MEFQITMQCLLVFMFVLTSNAVNECSSTPDNLYLSAELDMETSGTVLRDVEHLFIASDLQSYYMTLVGEDGSAVQDFVIMKTDSVLNDIWAKTVSHSHDYLDVAIDSSEANIYATYDNSG